MKCFSVLQLYDA